MWLRKRFAFRVLHPELRACDEEDVSRFVSRSPFQVGCNEEVPNQAAGKTHLRTTIVFFSGRKSVEKERQTICVRTVFVVAQFKTQNAKCKTRNEKRETNDRDSIHKPAHQRDEPLPAST